MLSTTVKKGRSGGLTIRRQRNASQTFSSSSLIKSNEERIRKAQERGTQPYFVRDNVSAINNILHPKPKELTTLEKAKLRHDARTPEQIEKIQRDWNERRMEQYTGKVDKIINSLPYIPFTTKQFNMHFQPIIDGIRNKESVDAIESRYNDLARWINLYEKSAKRHAARTAEDIRRIQNMADAHLYGQAYVDNIIKIENELGIKRGKRMTFEEANKLRGNPYYAESEQFRVNCQSCVVANELRRRGWDVEAYGNLKQTDTATYALSFRTEAAWVDADGNIPTPVNIAFVKRIKRSVDKRGRTSRRLEYHKGNEITKMVNDSTAEVGRYHISWVWDKSYPNGHIITAERLKDGTLRFYDPQNGKLSGIDFTKIYKLHGINILRVDNLRPNIDVVRGVVKKSGTTGGAPIMTEAQRQWWKDKARSKAVTGDNLGDLMKRISEESGSKRLSTLKETIAAKEFKKVDKHPNVFSVIGKETPDYNNLLACADKMADKGFEVYLLPNPGKARTPDLIIKKKGFTATYEVKTITGKSSAGTRLLDSGGQSNHVILNLATNYDPQQLANDIKSYFENNANATEVIVLKKKKMISIKRDKAMKKDFLQEFKRLYR